jgi:type I restriction enzyme, S subunit
MANDNHDSHDASTGLPAGWVWTTIGEAAKTTSGGTPSRKHPEYYGGSIPWIKSGELKGVIITNAEESISEDGLRNSSAKIFPKGTTLVALYGATVGKTGILGIDAATNQAVCAIFPKEESFTAKYMVYWLQFQRDALIKLSSGGAQPNISQGIVQSFPFPLAPLPEQHRIIAKIEEQFTRLDAGVAALKRAQANLKRYKAAVLKAACEGRLVAQDAGDEPASELLTRILAERQTTKARGRGDSRIAPTDDLPELPSGWCWATIDQLITMLQYGTSVKADAEAETGVPVIRMGNIQEGQLDFSNLKYIDPDKEDISKYSLTQGDILINRTNSPELVGKAGLFARNGVFVFASYLIRLLTDPNFFLPQYLVTCLNSEIGRRHVVKVKHQVAGQANINSQDIRTMPIPLPPLAEQRRIVAEVERRLSVVQELQGTLAVNLTRAERLRQSILKRAFEGKL